MNKPETIDRWALLQQVSGAAQRTQQPQTLYQSVESALAQLCGFKLFTLMVFDRGDGSVERVYTNQPDAYPVAGRKELADTPWYREVIAAKTHYIGNTHTDIEWAFADHALIRSLGCGSIINLLVIYDGEILGSANVLHEENHYAPADIENCLPFVQLLATPFQTAIAARG